MNFLYFLAGAVVGLIVASAVASVLKGIDQAKLYREIETLETELGVLRMRVNRQDGAKVPRPGSASGFIPSQAGANLGGGSKP